MTTQPLLTISAFARAVDLAPSTLRYYDEAGLLPPAEVDPATGYRYYTPDLERHATLIRRMREIGLPVETMRLVLAGTREDAARILRSYVEGAHRSARNAAGVVDDILASLDAEEATARVTVVTVDGVEAAAALRRVARAASAGEEPLRGVLLDVADRAVTVVATDRYWLASWEVPVGEAHAPERRAFVPAGEVERLADHLERRESAVVSVSGTRLAVGHGDDEVGFATATDRFPAYRLVVPGRGTGRAVLDRHRLAELVDRESAAPVRLRVGDDTTEVGRYGEGDRVRLSARTSGTPATLWFAPALLCRALDTLVGDTVALSWSAPDAAVRLSPVEQRRLDVLLMPVRPPT